MPNKKSAKSNITNKKLSIRKLIFLLNMLGLTLTIPTKSYSEIINIQNEEKNFGDWKVFCEVDVMMDLAHCKLASKFFENKAAISIESTSKFSNQLFIVIPQIKIGSFVQIRIDKNDLIFSRIITQKDFGLIPIDDQQKANLYRQMQSGSFLFIRFSTKSSEKEITAKISLKDFHNALNYYNSRNSK
jgi:invasion protein IalB